MPAYRHIYTVFVALALWAAIIWAASIWFR